MGAGRAVKRCSRKGFGGEDFLAKLFSEVEIFLAKITLGGGERRRGEDHMKKLGFF